MWRMEGIFSFISWALLRVTRQKVPSMKLNNVLNASTNICQAPFFVVIDYSKFKVAKLSDLLTARSLRVSWRKEEPVARLVEFDATTQTGVDDLGDLAPSEEECD